MKNYEQYFKKEYCIIVKVLSQFSQLKISCFVSCADCVKIIFKILKPLIIRLSSNCRRYIDSKENKVLPPSQGYDLLAKLVMLVPVYRLGGRGSISA